MYLILLLLVDGLTQFQKKLFPKNYFPKLKSTRELLITDMIHPLNSVNYKSKFSYGTSIIKFIH